jgi:NhaP-type Na+/H+ or K+/H+ antiporter
MPEASLTIGLALAAGMLAQVAARHLGIPGIVLLLGLGVVLGPEGLGAVQPASLGQGMRALVGFAVAIILFEGGLNLDIRRLRRVGKSIRQLVTIGAVVTAVGGTLAPRLILGWDWAPSILFGTLVIVTGPTVVTPLLRRIRVRRKVATVLEAEGIFGDAIGAIIAVVALEVIISPKTDVIGGAGSVLATLGAGALVGTIGGLVIALLLRRERLIPEGLESVTTLSLALALFQVSEAVQHESGIAAAIVGGLVVGNMRIRVAEELREFKEQLTVLFIGLLFILLAAGVQLKNVYGLGWPGVATVATLMFVVRPLNVIASTWNTDVTRKEMVFMSWLAPRGIVAAAVSSLFASELSRAGLPGGEALQGLVFLVIAATVLLQGLTGGIVARKLGLTLPTNQGYAILGANALARTVARTLTQAGEDVVLIDSNVDSCRLAEGLQLKVLAGSGLSENIHARAELSSRKGVLALTPSDSANLLFVRLARKTFKLPVAWASLHPGGQITPHNLHETGGRLAFGRTGDIDHWITHIERGTARLERWQVVGEGGFPPHALVVLAGQAGKVRPVDDESPPRAGETVYMLVPAEHRAFVDGWMTQRGWLRQETGPATGEHLRSGAEGS